MSRPSYFAPNPLISTVRDQGGAVFNVMAYGAKGDGVILTDGRMTLNSPILTSATAAFTSADVGKIIVVDSVNATGAVGGAGTRLWTTILSWQSATQVTLAANATMAVSTTTFSYGTDNTAIFQSVLNMVFAVGGRAYVPRGLYFLGNLTLPSNGGTFDQSLTVEGENPNLIYGGLKSRNRNGTQLRFIKADGSDFLSCNPTGTSYTSYKFKNLIISGPDGTSGGTQTTLAGSGIRINGTSQIQVYLEHINISGFQAPGSCGIWIQNMEDSSWKDVMVELCDWGIRLENDCNANSFVNVNTQLHTTYGLWIKGSESNAFVGGLVQSNLSTGLYMEGVLTTSFLSTHFENNNSANVGGFFIDINGTASNNNEHITFRNCQLNPGTTPAQIRLRGVLSGKTVQVHFDNGYFGSVDSPGIIISDVNCIGTRLTDYATASSVSDAGTQTSLFWKGQAQSTSVVNLPSGSSTNLYEGQVNGSVLWHVDSAGAVTGSGATFTNLVITGGMTTHLVSKSGSYTASPSDSIIVVTAGSVTINLPSAVTAGAGRQYVVKNNNQTSTILASPTAGTIDGASAVSMASAFQCVRVVSDGSNWLTI